MYYSIHRVNKCEFYIMDFLFITDLYHILSLGIVESSLKESSYSWYKIPKTLYILFVFGAFGNCILVKIAASLY